MAYTSLMTHGIATIGARHLHDDGASGVVLTLEMRSHDTSANLELTVFATAGTYGKFKRLVDAINEIFAEPDAEQDIVA